MPLYLGIQKVDSNSFTVEDVVKAHLEDFAIGERFGVVQKKYWVSKEAKTLFSLMEGPSKQACIMACNKFHDNTAKIIEVSDDEFNVFFGRGNINDSLGPSLSGQLDTGYRTILLISLIDLTGKYGHYFDKVYQLIREYQGIPLIQPDDDIMVSFGVASNAVLCALSIDKLLKSIPDNFEFSLALVSGKPIDEKGNYLFEETKKKVQYLCALGIKRTIYIDAETKAMSGKSFISPKIRKDDFKVVQRDDFAFLFQLFNVINNNLCHSDFKSEDLNGLLGLSKSKIYRKLKALAGISPNQFIQELRLRQSLKNLKQKSQTVAQIAYDLGFNSPTYYTRAFRKRYHILPTSFAKLYSL